MLAASRWIAKMRYDRRIKRLQKGFKDKDALKLVRADKNLAMLNLNNNKKTLDVCLLPFLFSFGAHRRYVICNNFYLVFPPEDDTSPTVSQDQILREYGAWLVKVKSEHDLPTGVVSILKKENRTFVHPDTMAALNHFFITNKFVCEGYVLSMSDDGEYPSITQVYHRTQPIPKDDQILINPNLFNLMESSGDITTYAQIHNEWCGSVVAKIVSMAQLGVDTDIQSVPLDKALYAVVTSALKTAFYPQAEHVNVYPVVAQKY